MKISLNSLFFIFWTCQIVFWLIESYLDHFDPQKNWSAKITGRYNGFLSLKVNILSTQSVFFFLACNTARVPNKLHKLFFMEYATKVIRKMSSTYQTIYYTPCCLYKNAIHKWNAIYSLMIGSLVFSVCIKVCKDFKFVTNS